MHAASPASEMSARLRNKNAALSHIRRTGGCSRTELMQVLGLSRSGVAHIVAMLLGEGAIVERRDATRNTSKRGRPAMVLLPRGDGGLVLGIDFGHGHVSVAVADHVGQILAEDTRHLDVDIDAAAAVQEAAQMARTLVRLTRLLKPVTYAVAGVPGPVDARSGRVVSPTILSDWVDVAPRTMLMEALQVPVTIEHDTLLGAMGEQRRGAGQGVDDMLYVKISGGVGAGLIINGMPYRGSAGLAGEIGHTKVAGTIELCRCGSRGCLETVVSVERLRIQLGLATGTAFGTTSAEVTDFSRVTDPAGIRVLSEAGWVVGRVLSDVCNCFNPRAVVLGGLLGSSASALLDGVRSAIARFAEPSIGDSLTVVSADFGTRAELVGAVVMAADLAATGTA